MNYRGYNCNPKYSEEEKMYHGKIDGLPEAGEISGATIDDFIRAFHLCVDSILDGRTVSARKKNRSGWIVFLVLVALVVTAALTCPDRKQHVQVISDRLSVLFEDSETKYDDYGIFGAFMEGLMETATIESMISVDDYFLFNVGKVTIDGEGHVMSVGAFGHVFTMSREQIRKRLRTTNGTQSN